MMYKKEYKNYSNPTLRNEGVFYYENTAVPFFMRLAVHRRLDCSQTGVILLKKTYYFFKKKSVIYNEVLADSDVFEKFYEIENGKKAQLIVIPDGSVDIQCVWKNGQMSAYICGSVMNGMVSRVNGYDKCFGARFRVGVLPGELREHLDIIMDNRILLNTVLDIPQMDAYLKEELYLEQKADIMLKLFEHESVAAENTLITYLVKEIEKKKGHVLVSELVDTTGYSHRYANHVFKTNVGCSIKKYAGIIRLQESLACLMNQDDDAIYSELGYYDQAHFIKDFKNFTASTPSVFKKNSGKFMVV